jgi:hypothetical protein
MYDSLKPAVLADSIQVSNLNFVLVISWLASLIYSADPLKQNCLSHAQSLGQFFLHNHVIPIDSHVLSTVCFAG